MKKFNPSNRALIILSDLGWLKPLTRTFGLFLAFALISLNSFGQASSYGFTATTGTYAGLSSGTTNVPSLTASSDDNLSGSIPIGFTFAFAGSNYTTCKLSSNGWLTFNTAYSGSSQATNSSGNASTIGNVLGPVWDDLSTITYIPRYRVDGTSPNRIFKVEFSSEWSYNSSVQNLECQIWLYEGSNQIDYIYNDLGNTLVSTDGTICIHDGTTYLSLNNASASPTASSATFTTNVTSVPATDQIYRWTPPACATPGSILASGVSTTTATISWGAVSPVPSGGYDYYVTTSATAPTAATTPTGNTSSTNTALSGLTANTLYYAWVRSNCGGSQSAWGGITFTTSCAPGTIPFTDGFESGQTDQAAMVNCWSAVSTTGAQIWTANSSLTNFNRTANTGSFNAYLRYGNEDWLFYELTLVGGTVYQFDAYARQDGTGTANANLTLAYGGSASAAGMTNTVVAATGLTNGAYQLISGTFTPATSGNYFIGIRGWINGSPWYVSLDDVSVTLAPACAAQPSAFTATANTPTTATLDWTAASPVPSGGYDYYYSTSATAPTGATTPTGNTSGVSQGLTGLTANTTYYAWVRSNCTTVESDWVGVETFTTPCVAGTIPFADGFEADQTDQANLAGCWSQESADGFQFLTANSSLTTYNRTARTGSFNAYLRYSNEDWMFYKLALVGGTEYTMDVYARQDGGTSANANITLAYGTVGTIAGMTTTVTTATGVVNGGYQLVTGNFTPATSGDYYVGIRAWINGSPWYLSIDDVAVYETPSCSALPTAFGSSAVTTNSATLSWTAASPVPPSGYDYYYSTSATAPTGATTPSGNTTGVSVGLSGLTANTTYYAWVRSNCTSSESAWTTVETFSTLCNPGTIPFADGFEADQTDQTDAAGCWSQESVGGFQTWTANNTLTTYNRTARTGSYNAYLRYSNEDWLFYQLTLVGGTEYTFDCYARQDGGTSTNSNITLAYGNAGTAAGMTNTVVAATGIINGGYQLISGTFTPATSGNYYVGIKGWMNGSPWYISVDDVAVYETPSCAQLPSTLSSTSITTSSADVSWLAASPVPGSGYDYYYSTSATAPTGATTPSGNVASGLTASLSGLTANTTYYVWVRSNCTSSQSNWVGSEVFTTLCDPGTIPFFDGFETDQTDQVTSAGCWSQESTAGTQVWTSNSSLTTYNRTPNTGSFNSYLRYGNTDWIFYELTLVGGTLYEFEVYARQDGGTSTNADITLAWGNTATAAGMTNTVVAATGITNGAYQLISGTFFPATSGNYFIGIRGNINFSPWYISLDDVSVDVAPPCAQQPSALSATPTAPTTATLAWTAAGPAPAGGYDYYYSTSATAPTGVTTPSGNVAGVTVGLTGLTGNTTYYAWVRSNCTGTYSDWVGAATFNTPCAPGAIPFTEGFEADQTDQDDVAGCWSQESGFGFQNWTANSTVTTYNRAARTGSFNAYLRYNNEDWLFYPLDLVGGTVYQFDVYARQDGGTSTNADIRLAYGTTGTIAGMTNVISTTGITNGAYQLVDGVFTPATTGTYYIGIRGFSNSSPWYISIDDIAVYEAPPCSAQPTAFASSNLDETTATLSWTAASPVPPNGYDYYVSTDPTAPVSATTPTGNTTGVSVGLTGLTAQTTYYAWVRSNCGGLQTAWVGVETFTTLCAAASVPFTEGFETGFVDVTDVDGCWSQESAGGGNNWTANSSATTYNRSARTGAWNAYLRYGNEDWMFYRLALVGGTEYTFDVYARQDGTSGADMTLAYGSAGTAAGMTNTVVTATALTNGSYQLISGTFTPATSGNYFIGIMSDLSFAPWYTSVDDIAVYETPPCAPMPSALASSAIGITDATISWSAASPAPIGGYDYYLSTSATAPTAATTPTGNVAGLTEALSGLSAFTTYNVWVRSNCTGGDESNWVGPETFTTLCGAGTVPFLDDFEADQTDQADLAGCWSQESANGTQNWTANSTLTSYNRSPRSGSFNAYLRYGNTDWMFYELTLVGGTDYTFDVYARQDGGGSANSNITLAYGNTGTAAGMTNTVLAATGIVNGGYQLISGTFTPATSGDYFVGIRGFMNSSPWYISVDDVAVYETPACLPPTALNMGTVNATSATMHWTGALPVPNTGYDTYISTSSTPPTAVTVPTGGTGSLFGGFTGLTGGTQYYAWVRSNCGGGDLSAWVGLDFYTRPVNDECVTATDLPCGTTSLAGTTNGSIAETVTIGCGMSTVGVWYTFSGNGLSTTISAQTAGYDIEMGIASGSCGSLSNVTCRDAAFATGTESYTFTTTVGVQYYVYVGHYSSFNTSSGDITMSRTCDGDIWTGTNSSDWADPGNWADGSVPSVVENAFIPSNPTGGNFPEVTNSELVGSLVVDENAMLTVLTGGALTVNSSLSNNGTIDVQNDGSLVQVNGSTLSGSGQFSVERIGSAVYDYWSFPITTGSPSFLGGPLVYDPSLGTADASDDYNDPGWVGPGASIVDGKGYAAHGAGARTFLGTANNGNLNIGVTSHGLPNVSWNLVGNPYPSGISISNFLSANSGVINQNVALWDDPGTTPYATGDYAYHNGLIGNAGGGGNTPTGTLGSAQGFMVEATGNGNLQFTNTMRVADNTAMLFRPAQLQSLHVSVTNDQNMYNQTTVGFYDDASNTVDQYDTPKLNSLSDLSLYTFIGADSYAINFYSPLISDTEIPIGLNSGLNSQVTFTLDDFENLDNDDIVLEDRYLNVFTDLKQSDYSFTAMAQLYGDRFFLHFSSSSVTGIEEATSVGMNAFMVDGLLNIFSVEEMTGSLEILDMSGRIVLGLEKINLGPNGIQLSLNELSDGVYIVRIVNDDINMSQKILK